MKNVFVSMPMTGRTHEEILKELLRVYVLIWDKYGQEVDIANGWYGFKEVEPVFMLGHAIQVMSQADTVLFAKGWENSRGCCVEHEVAKRYDMNIIYEEDVF